MNAFDPSTPPGRDEHGSIAIGVASADEVERLNAQRLGEVAEAEMTRVVGTTATAAAKTEAEQRMEHRRQADRERVAQSGGTTVTSVLRGTVGEAVAETLRLDLIDGTFRRIENSIADERAAILARGGPAPAAQHLRGLVAEAVEQAQTKKGSVPSVLAEHLRWLYNRRADEPMGHQLTLALTELREQKASARLTRISERLPEVDQLVLEFAADVLDRARTAASTLESAGLSPDSTSDEVLAALDLEAQKAWHAWRQAVSDWSDVQSARRFIAEQVHGRGPTQTQGEYALSAAPGVDIAAEAWSTQFVEVQLPRWCNDAHSALKFAVAQGSDLRPAGVADLTIEKGSN